jgi:hypothetical protein
MKIKDIHLVAFYVQKPRAGVQTQVAGWNKDPANYQYDERVEFTKGLSNKDAQYAGVILNLSTKKVVAQITLRISKVAKNQLRPISPILSNNN